MVAMATCVCIAVIEVDGNVRSSIGNIINIYNDGTSFGVRNFHHWVNLCDIIMCRMVQ